MKIDSPLRRGPVLVPLQKHNRRRGYGLIEATIAVLLLGIALVLTVQIATTVARDRLYAERRQRAVIEVSNLMETISLLDYSKIDEASLKSMSFSESARKSLPGASLSVRVINLSSPVPRKRVTIEATFPETWSGPKAPVRLVSWFVEPNPAQGGAK